MTEDLVRLTLSTASESAQAVGPLAAVLVLVFLLFFRDVPRRSLWAMVKGVVVAAVGLMVFLLGVRFGFVPYAQEMGRILAEEQPLVVLMITSLALGIAVTVAEPAVRVLAVEVCCADEPALKRMQPGDAWAVLEERRVDPSERPW